MITFTSDQPPVFFGGGGGGGAGDHKTPVRRVTAFRPMTTFAMGATPRSDSSGGASFVDHPPVSAGAGAGAGDHVQFGRAVPMQTRFVHTPQGRAVHMVAPRLTEADLKRSAEVQDLVEFHRQRTNQALEALQRAFEKKTTPKKKVRKQLGRAKARAFKKETKADRAAQRAEQKAQRKR
jgi:hypothetical protein